MKETKNWVCIPEKDSIHPEHFKKFLWLMVALIVAGGFVCALGYWI